MDDSWMHKRIEQVLASAALYESQRWARRIVMSSAAAGVLVFGEFACTVDQKTEVSLTSDAAVTADGGHPRLESDPVITIKYGVDWREQNPALGLKPVRGLDVKPLPADLGASTHVHHKPPAKPKPTKIDVGETNRYGVRYEGLVKPGADEPLQKVR